MTEKTKSYTIDDILFAYEEAANCLELSEYGGDHPDPQNAAYREVARRIRAAAKRINLKQNHTGITPSGVKDSLTTEATP